MDRFTRPPHEQRKGQARRHLLLPWVLQSTRMLTGKPAPFPILRFPLSPTERFERQPASLSCLLSPTKQTPALGWTATLLIWPYQVIEFHFSNILSFSDAYLAWKWSIFHLEKKALWSISFKGKPSWLLQSDFPYIKCYGKPNSRTREITQEVLSSKGKGERN